MSYEKMTIGDTKSELEYGGKRETYQEKASREYKETQKRLVAEERKRELEEKKELLDLKNLTKDITRDSFFYGILFDWAYDILNENSSLTESEIEKVVEDKLNNLSYKFQENEFKKVHLIK